MEEISRQLSLIQTKNPKEMMENLKIGGLSLINVMMRLLCPKVLRSWKTWRKSRMLLMWQTF
mgnify:CR=1 FL=1